MSWSRKRKRPLEELERMPPEAREFLSDKEATAYLESDTMVYARYDRLRRSGKTPFEAVIAIEGANLLIEKNTTPQNSQKA